LGHFPEAIEEFEKAYDLKPEPVFLFNIAQGHRQNGNLQRAVFFYRRYLEANPKAKDRADVEKRIKDTESQLAAEKERSLAPAAAAPQPAQPTVVVMQAPAPAPAAVQTAPAPPPKSEGTPGRGLLIAGIVTGGVGLLAIGGGVYSAVHASNLYDEAYQGQYDSSKEQSSKTFRTLEWVSFAVGGAAVVTGTILIIVGATSKGERSSVALAPLLAPGVGGASVFGRF
jgi:tetratricopeptide (TPR) repeat protein